jgi:hypothetical protein
MELRLELNMPVAGAMSRHFNPDDFLLRMRKGEFDGRLTSQLQTLSNEELVAVLKAMQSQNAMARPACAG